MTTTFNHPIECPECDETITGAVAVEIPEDTLFEGDWRNMLPPLKIPRWDLGRVFMPCGCNLEWLPFQAYLTAFTDKLAEAGLA